MTPDLSTEAQYRYDERLAILGCYGEPTMEQHLIAYREACEFDFETQRRLMRRKERTKQ
jgi:hypothetical protein